MTTTAIEILHGQTPVNTAATPTITTALVPTDRVVVVVVKNATTGTPIVTGLGATWVGDVVQSSGADLYIISATGITGGGVVTVNPNSIGFVAEWAVYVVRSDAGVASTKSFGAGVTASISPAGAIVSTLAAQSSLAGAFVVAAGWVSSGTIDFPQASSTPSTGWTADHSFTNAKIVSHVSPANESIQPKITSTQGATCTMAHAAYYDGVVPGTPIENRLHGVYVESLEVEGPSEMRIHTAYAEALVKEGPSEMRVHRVYVEVLTSVTEATPPPDTGDIGGTWGG